MFDFLLRPFRRNFGRDKEYYRQIDDMFGFIPNNIELYKLALIHKSASFVLPDGSQMNNERLEYLGDAIIEAVTSDYLYIEFPDKTEGFLTQLRSKIVSRHSLNLLAERIGLDRFLVAHAGATLAQKHIYGDAFEAMVGAIYLDQGYDFTNRLLINFVYANYLDMDSLSEEETDFKSRLIEWCQKNHHTIRFETKHSSSTQFISTVFIDDMEVSHGYGTSKKESEQHAAQTMAQTVSDSACLRMLDKLDKLDQAGDDAMQSAPVNRTKRARKPKSEEPAKEGEQETQPKSERAQRSRTEKSLKPAELLQDEGTEKQEHATDEPLLSTEEHPEPESVATEPDESVKQKRPRRAPRKRPSADLVGASLPEKTDDAVPSESVEQSEPSVEAEPSESRSEKPRRPRRKPARREAKPTDSTEGVESARTDEAESSNPHSGDEVENLA